MNPERWERLSGVLEGAMDLPEEARRAFIEAQCPDPEDRAEVLSLLSHAPLGTLAPPSGLSALAREALGPSVGVGQSLGPWRLTELVGEGGMGVVYAAQHQELGKRAAVKLVRRAMPDPFARARFQQERLILSRLEHPNIARVLDGGTEGGMPYFVMEFVEGVPLVQWARERQATVAQRLRLFYELCLAVQYAHRNLVVHRDLKPSNALVTADGTPKLLDFGIARLLEGAESAALTGTADRLMTPEYASPEQVRGEPVSTATDVYALGAILFELLTGERAQKIRSIADTVRVVCEEPTPRPSAVVADRALARQLRGDLDNIVAMAMRKDPDRRYPSAGELAEDIRRHLETRPVSARPDTFAYRWSRFVARNRLAVGLAALALLSGIAGLAGTLRMAQARAEEAARAERRFAEVRQLANSFLFDFDAEIARVPGTTRARELVVETAQTYLERLAEESGDDPALLAELAVSYRRLADVQGHPSLPSLGRYADSRASFERARELRERLLVIDPADRVNRRALAGLLIDSADVYEELGEREARLAAVRRATEVAGPLAENPSPEDLYTLADAWRVRGNVAWGQDHNEDAINAFNESIRISRTALTLHPTPEQSRLLAGALERLSSVLSWRGDMEGGRVALEEVVRLREEDLARAPEDPKQIHSLIVAYQLLSHLLYERERPSLEDPASARPYSERALSLAEEMAARDAANATAAGDLARSLFGVAAFYVDEDPERAVELYDRAVAAAGAMGEGTDRLYGQVYVLRLSVVPVRKLGRTAEARARIARARAYLVELETLAGGSVSYLDALLRMEEALTDLAEGEVDRARQTLEQGVQTALTTLNEEPDRVDYQHSYALSLERIAQLHRRAGDAAAACAALAERARSWESFQSRGVRSPFSERQSARAREEAGACLR